MPPYDKQPLTSAAFAAFLAGVQSLHDCIDAGVGVGEIFGDAVAFFRSEDGHEREDAAQRGGNVVNVIHHADGFAREWHNLHISEFLICIHFP